MCMYIKDAFVVNVSPTMIDVHRFTKHPTQQGKTHVP